MNTRWQAHSWSVRRVRTFQGMEGLGFNAELLRDGKPVAFVIDDGNGGQYNIRWYTRTTKTENEEQRLTEFVESHTHVNELNGKPYRAEPDTLIGELVDKYENNRKFKRLSKTRTLFRLKSDPGDSWSSIRVPYSAEVTTRLIKQYGKDLVRVYDPRVGL